MAVIMNATAPNIGDACFQRLEGPKSTAILLQVIIERCNNLFDIISRCIL
jgi:hypothetical protein